MNALRATFAPHRIALSRPELDAPLLVQHAAPDTRPFLHPILAPDGRGEVTEDAPTHHPWQHGLYVGLNDVNGAGFWLEGKREASRAGDGTFHPRPLRPPVVEGPVAGWSVETEWRAPSDPAPPPGPAGAGAPLLEETQTWRLRDDGALLALDLEWRLRALTDLAFGRYAYGGVFLRMPFRAERGGTVCTSEGQGSQAGAEGQRARWVAVAMPLDGRPAALPEAGVAVLDHPANPAHPVPWRVDTQLGISPSRCIAGSWALPAGETATERYRFLVFAGPIRASWIDAQWRRFAGESGTSGTTGALGT